MTNEKVFEFKMVEAKGGRKRYTIQDFENESFKGFYVGREKGFYMDKLIFMPLDNPEKTVEICGITDLLNKMENVPINSLCEISFAGSKNLQNGNKFLLARVYYCEMEEAPDGTLVPKA